MLPIALDVAVMPILLVGQGSRAVVRLAQLDQAGAGQVQVYAAAPCAELELAAEGRLKPGLPTSREIAGARLLLVAGLDDDSSAELALIARRSGVLVNVEDKPALCDFSLAATVRRGDLMLSVSTGGKAPGLAAHLRGVLGEQFGPEWADHLRRLEDARQAWRAEGRSGDDLRALTAQLIEREGWLS